MEKIYNIFYSAVDIVLAHRKKTLVIGICLTFCAILCIAVVILQGFYNSADEYAHVYYAKMLSMGKFFIERHPIQEFLAPTYIAVKENKVFSFYPPAWSVVLAAAMSIKIPIIMVNPIIGVLSLFMVFLLARELFDEKVAVISVFTVFISAFFLVNSASFFGHSLCAFFILCYAFFSIKYTKTEIAKHAFLAGVFLGCVFITRFYTGIVAALPLLIFMVRRPKMFSKTVWFIVGAVPSIAFLCFQNYCITGNPFMLPLIWMGGGTGLVDKPWYMSDYCPFMWFQKGAFIKGMDFLLSRMVDLLRWSPPVLLFVYLFRLPSLLKFDKKECITGTVFFFLMLGYFGYGVLGGNQYGPRYYYEGYPLLVIAVIGYLFSGEPYVHKPMIKKIFINLFFFSLIINMFTLTDNLINEKKLIWQRTDIYRLMKKQNIHNAVVFLTSNVGEKKRVGTKVLERMVPSDLTRNEIGFNQDILYVLFRGKEYDKVVKNFFPKRKLYLYWYNWKTNKGEIAPYNL